MLRVVPTWTVRWRCGILDSVPLRVNADTIDEVLAWFARLNHGTEVVTAVTIVQDVALEQTGHALPNRV